MAKTRVIGSKVSALTESVGQLTGQLDANLGSLADLQRRVLVLTAPDEALSETSFDVVPGSPDETIQGAMAVHRATADLVEQSVQMVSALAVGAESDEIDKRQSMLEAATEKLKALQPMEASELSQEEKDTKADAEEAHVAHPKTAKQAELEGVGAEAFGALRIVNKMAGKSDVGKISGIVYLVGDHVETAIRMKKGQEALADLAPKIEPDFESMVEALLEGGPHFSAAARDLVARAIEWSDTHRPEASDPARLGYDMRLASLISDARTVEGSIDQCDAGLRKVGPAFKEIVGLLTSTAEEDGSSHALTKAVGGDLRAIARVRIF